MTLHNFKMINVISSNVGKPAEIEFVFCAIIIYFCFSKGNQIFLTTKFYFEIH